MVKHCLTRFQDQSSDGHSIDVTAQSVPSISLHNSENPLKVDYKQRRRGGQLQCNACSMFAFQTLICNIIPPPPSYLLFILSFCPLDKPQRILIIHHFPFEAAAAADPSHVTNSLSCVFWGCLKYFTNSSTRTGIGVSPGRQYYCIA